MLHGRLGFRYGDKGWDRVLFLIVLHKKLEFDKTLGSGNGI